MYIVRKEMHKHRLTDHNNHVFSNGCGLLVVGIDGRNMVGFKVSEIVNGQISLGVNCGVYVRNSFCV